MWQWNHRDSRCNELLVRNKLVYRRFYYVRKVFRDSTYYVVLEINRKLANDFKRIIILANVTSANMQVNIKKLCIYLQFNL